MHNASIATEPAIKIGHLAKLAEVSANAVRFYEREGLMHVPPKSASGYRLYGPEAVERLRFIRQAQRCGFTLAEIQELLRLRSEASTCCTDVRAKVIEKKIEMHRRIKELKAMSEELDRLLADCGDAAASADYCVILATLSNGTAHEG